MAIEKLIKDLPKSIKEEEFKPKGYPEDIKEYIKDMGVDVKQLLENLETEYSSIKGYSEQGIDYSLEEIQKQQPYRLIDDKEHYK
jgi:hypothetical protein